MIELPRTIRFSGLCLLLCLCLAATTASAQEEDVHRVGALTLDATYWMHPDAESHGMLLRATAMAADVVPGTFVGRFAELRASIGADFTGELLPYELTLKLGVGLGTDYLIMFLGTGLNFDAFQSLGDSADAIDIPFGIGIPLVLGVWITPMDAFHVYAMAEPAWYPWVEERQTTVSPLDVGEEMRSRLGLGLDIGGVSMRAEYMHYQVSPTSYHLFTLGFGTKPDLEGL